MKYFLARHHYAKQGDEDLDPGNFILSIQNPTERGLEFFITRPGVRGRTGGFQKKLVVPVEPKEKVVTQTSRAKFFQAPRGAMTRTNDSRAEKS